MKRPLVIFAAAIILVAGLYEYSLHASPIAANPLASVAQVILSVVVVDTGSNSGNNNSSPTPSSPPAGAGAAGAPPAPQSQVIEPKPNDISDAKIDVNGDGKIDLADFSILAYWFGKPLTDAGKKVDLNGDGKVNLVDFSILAYHWKRK